VFSRHNLVPFQLYLRENEEPHSDLLGHLPSQMQINSIIFSIPQAGFVENARLGFTSLSLRCDSMDSNNKIAKRVPKKETVLQLDK
jgi:hypothetical protein